MADKAKRKQADPTAGEALDKFLVSAAELAAAAGRELEKVASALAAAISRF